MWDLFQTTRDLPKLSSTTLFRATHIFTRLRLYCGKEQTMTLSLREIPIYNGSYDDLANEIKLYLNLPNPPAHIVTLNPEIWVDAQTNSQLHTAITSARWVTADGIGIVMGQRLLKIPSSPRRTGADLTHHLLASGGLRFYLLGSTQDAVEAAVETIKKRYPNATISGFMNGFFSLDMLPKIGKTIQACAPDIILVGMGSPRQDLVIAELKMALSRGVIIGVGGVIDVLAGTVQRAPKWMQQLGIEWLWRIARQPQRISRLLRTIPRFISSIYNPQ